MAETKDRGCTPAPTKGTCTRSCRQEPVAYSLLYFPGTGGRPATRNPLRRSARGRGLTPALQQRSPARTKRPDASRTLTCFDAKSCTLCTMLHLHTTFLLHQRHTLSFPESKTAKALCTQFHPLQTTCQNSTLITLPTPTPSAVELTGSTILRALDSQYGGKCGLLATASLAATSKNRRVRSKQQLPAKLEHETELSLVSSSELWRAEIPSGQNVSDENGASHHWPGDVRGPSGSEISRKLFCAELWLCDSTHNEICAHNS